MWQEFVAAVMPLVVDILALLVVIFVKQWIIPVLQAKLGKDRLDAIARIALEAYAFVEVQAPGLAIYGKEKLAMATDYMNRELAKLHIPVTADQIRAAIEDVWLSYNPPPIHTPEENAG